MITTISQTAKILYSANKIALFCHTNPDGDTVGAAVALALGLKKIGKQVNVFCDQPIGDKLLRFEATRMVSDIFSGDYDLMVAIDCGDIYRLGQFSGEFDAHRNTLTIDHHCGQPYAKNSLLLDYSSTAEIVFDLLSELGVTLDKDIATLIYIGLTTDTGNFSHANTNAKTFETARELCGYGVFIPEIVRIFFKHISFNKTRFNGKIINRMRSYFDGQLCLIYVTKQDLAEFDLKQEDTSNLVDFCIAVESARVGICLSEHSDNVYKVSMRGKDLAIREICELYGGGGHNFASGCMISGFLEDIIDRLVKNVGDVL